MYYVIIITTGIRDLAIYMKKFEIGHDDTNVILSLENNLELLTIDEAQKLIKDVKAHIKYLEKYNSKFIEEEN